VKQQLKSSAIDIQRMQLYRAVKAGTETVAGILAGVSTGEMVVFGRDIRRCPYCGRGSDDAVWRDPCAEQFAGRMWPSL